MKLNVKVGFIGLLDMLKFKNMSKERDKVIEAAPDSLVRGEYRINSAAALIHPDFQSVKVASVTDDHGAKLISLESRDGKSLAVFRAGQYVSLYLKVGDSVVSRPYSLCSSPADAGKGLYAICVKSTGTGDIADWICGNVKEGDELTVSGPEGHFHYSALRDAETVIGLAGGSGITPFVSMAKAIDEGTEHFRLTVLYGCNTMNDAILDSEIAAIAERCADVSLVHVLRDEKSPGAENGLLTREVLKKYAPDGDYSVFVCGPSQMYDFVREELKGLRLASNRVCYEVMGVPKNVYDDPRFPEAAKNVEFNVIVRQGSDEYLLKAPSNQPLLVSMEKAGIPAPARCRAGECAWCRSKVTAGNAFVPARNDLRRYLDKKRGVIHPCASYPLSDMIIEVPGCYSFKRDPSGA